MFRGSGIPEVYLFSHFCIVLNLKLHLSHTPPSIAHVHGKSPISLNIMTFGLNICQVNESKSRAGVSGNNVAQDMCAQFVPMIQGAAIATSNNRVKETEKTATLKKIAL